MSAPALCGRLLGSLVRDSANEMARWSDRRSDILLGSRDHDTTGAGETTGAKTAPQLNHGVKHTEGATCYLPEELGVQMIKPRLRATEPFAYYQAGWPEKVKRKVSARSASLVLT